MPLVKAIGNQGQIGRRIMVVRVQRIKGRLETLTRFPRRQLWRSVQQCRARCLSPGSCMNCWASSVDDCCRFTVPPRSPWWCDTPKNSEWLELSMFLQNFGGSLWHSRPSAIPPPTQHTSQNTSSLLAVGRGVSPTDLCTQPPYPLNNPH